MKIKNKRGLAGISTLALIYLTLSAVESPQSINAFDPFELFKTGITWIGDISILISAADQLGSLYVCGGLCSITSDRTNADVINQIGDRLDVLTERIELLQFGESVRTCHSLVRSRNQALSGPLSTLDTETLAENVASFDDSGGRACLTIIHDAIMGNGLSNDAPALDLYFAFAQDQTTTENGAVYPLTLTETLDILAIFWAELVALENTLFAQTYWGINTFHENEEANATSSLGSLSNQFTLTMKEQFAYAGNFFGCRPVNVGWLRFPCASRRRNLTELRMIDDSLTLPELFENQTDRVHEPKLFRIASYDPDTTTPTLQWLKSWTSTSEFTTDFMLAAVIGVLDGAQQPPEFWTDHDPLFCLRNKIDSTFLHIDGIAFGNERCGPRGTFSLQLYSMPETTAPISYGCDNGLQKGAACCPRTCSSCAGSTTNTSSTCELQGTNTATSNECCSAAILNPILSPDVDLCSPNATLDDGTAPCVLDVPVWPALPRDDAYELVCLRHNVTGKFIRTDRSTEVATVKWMGRNVCSVEDGTVWMLFPSTVAEVAFETDLGNDQDDNVLNSGVFLGPCIEFSVVLATVSLLFIG